MVALSPTRTWCAALIGALTVATVACGSEASGSEVNSATILSGNQLTDDDDGSDTITVEFATFDDPGDAAPEALLAGDLAVQQGCLVVKGSQEHTVLPILAKSQIEVVDDELFIAGQPVREGMTVEWGGGSSVTGVHSTVPDGCEGVADEAHEFLAFTLD